jgi:pre-mRNA-splicing factor 38A
MSNRTDSKAKQIHGMNPQFLLETILRNKIYNTMFWKQKCFALTSETLIDRAVELKYIGGTFGVMKNPTDFMCLILKLLQIQPAEEIINEFLSEDYAEYKYLRALAAFYVRLTDKSHQVYMKLEPLYNDYRKLRILSPDGTYSITHMDEYIELLLNSESVYDITLPKLTKRAVLEQSQEIAPRLSLLEADLNLNDDNLQDEKDDYDFNLPEDRSQSESESDEEKSIQRQENDDRPLTKKQKIEQINDADVDENIDEKLKKLDPDSPEYWMLMRKKIGIN